MPGRSGSGAFGVVAVEHMLVSPHSPYDARHLVRESNYSFVAVSLVGLVECSRL
jgi:hypothetical protein